MKVAIIMGSNSDWPILEPAEKTLKEFGVEVEVVVAVPEGGEFQEKTVTVTLGKQESSDKSESKEEKEPEDTQEDEEENEVQEPEDTDPFGKWGEGF